MTARHGIAEGCVQGELRVTMTLPQAGWVRIDLPDLLPENRFLRCSYVYDPFRCMIGWLEAIARGEPSAVWSIDEEGYFSHVIYQHQPEIWDTPPRGSLIVCGASDELRALYGTMVEARALVAGFWRAFQAMVSHPDYAPREWEMAPAYPVDFDQIDYEDPRWTEELDARDEALRHAHPYDGWILRYFESELIENYVGARA